MIIKSVALSLISLKSAQMITWQNRVSSTHICFQALNFLGNIPKGSGYNISRDGDLEANMQKKSVFWQGLQVANIAYDLIILTDG